MRALLGAILFAAAASANAGPETNAAAPTTAAPAAPQPQRRSCARAPGSDTVVCGTQAQQGAYRIPRLPPTAYGPPLPSAQADLGKGVRARLRGQANGRRNRSAATLSVPF
jgi:hypothetical protein